MKTKRELINGMYTNAANLKHIAETGTINGSLKQEIERVMETYASQFKTNPIEVIKNRIAELKHEWYNTETPFGPDYYNNRIAELNHILKLIQ